MIGGIICWLKGRHDWTKWVGSRYVDGRVWYWHRECKKCYKIESVLEEPK